MIICFINVVTHISVTGTGISGVPSVKHGGEPATGDISGHLTRINQHTYHNIPQQKFVPSVVFFPAG